MIPFERTPVVASSLYKESPQVAAKPHPQRGRDPEHWHVPPLHHAVEHGVVEREAVLHLHRSQPFLGHREQAQRSAHEHFAVLLLELAKQLLSDESLDVAAQRAAGVKGVPTSCHMHAKRHEQRQGALVESPEHNLTLLWRQLARAGREHSVQDLGPVLDVQPLHSHEVLVWNIAFVERSFAAEDNGRRVRQGGEHESSVGWQLLGYPSEFQSTVLLRELVQTVEEQHQRAGLSPEGKDVCKLLDQGLVAHRNVLHRLRVSDRTENLLAYASQDLGRGATLPCGPEHAHHQDCVSSCLPLLVEGLGQHCRLAHA
mmetsp:Transcript_13787/g.31987  ORF Transcript_13787/g.31987 Transcript_13787/m.31987 type:complete len:314 (-) Transcript_13787:1585-2526(-)